MNASGLPHSWNNGTERLAAMRLAVVLLLLALAYLMAAVVMAPRIAALVKGLLFTLRLFLIASAPTIGGLAFLWSDRAISDERRRRLAWILASLLWAFAVIAPVSILPW
jgi:hypothetical protein